MIAILNRIRNLLSKNNMNEKSTNVDVCDDGSHNEDSGNSHHCQKGERCCKRKKTITPTPALDMLSIDFDSTEEVTIEATSRYWNNSDYNINRVEKVRELAYYKWQNAGCPDHMSDHFWAEAESEVA